MTSPPEPLRVRLGNRLGQASLVLLRLVIGWHLLVQGWEKIESVRRGPSDSGQPWTSRGYLLEAQGPLAPWFRQLAGDPEAAALEFLRLPPRRAPQEPDYGLPIRVEEIWDQYHKRFVTKLLLRPEASTLFERLLKAHKQAFVTVPVPMMRDYPAGPVTLPMPLAQHIEDFLARSHELRSTREGAAQHFGGSAVLPRTSDRISSLNRQRAELLREVAARTEALQRDYHALHALVTPYRVPAGVFASFALPAGQLGPTLFYLTLAPSARLSIEKLPEEPRLALQVPLEIAPGPWLAWTDFIMRWGLFLSGLALLLGLFTRPACLLGALLLLLIYLAQPPLPWLPISSRLPGYTPFVNGVLIEALALVALAAFPTGRWLGLDALLKLLPRRQAAVRQKALPPEPPPAGKRTGGTGKHRRYTGT